jgi:DNA polymerase-3 subunit epsilon
VVRDEVGGHEPAHPRAGQHTAQGLKTRWPLEEMLGADLRQAAAAAHRGAGQRLRCSCEVDAALWLKVDSFSLLQALAYLAGAWSTSTTSSWCSCACRRGPAARSSTWSGSAR